MTIAQLDEIKAAEADYIVGLAISIGALIAGVILGYDRVAPEWRPAFVMFGLVVFALAFNAGYLYRVFREWRKV